MNSQKAVSILKKQIVKLEQNDFNYPTWTIQSKTYLKSFFGESSEQHQFFNVHFWNISNAGENITIEVKKHIATTFIYDCIDTIEDLGLNKADPKGNFISRLPDSWAVAIIFGLLTFSFWLGTIMHFHE